MRQTITAVVTAAALLCALPAFGKKKEKTPPAPASTEVPAAAMPESPTTDPGKTHKLAGIVTADIGVGLLVGGIIMLALSATVADSQAERRGLELAGGLCTGVGGAAALIGVLIWVQGRSETKEWKASRRAFMVLPTFGKESAGVSLQMRF